MSRGVSMLFLLVAGLECASGSLMRSHRSSGKHEAHFRSALSRASARSLSSSHIDENSIHKALRLFTKFDTDEDGMITYDQLVTILSDEFRYTNAVIREMTAGLQPSHSGHVNIDEYLALFFKKKESADDKRNAGYFGLMDENNNGTLDARELAAGMEFTDSEARKLIRKWDKDGSGSLDFDEFNAMIQSVDRA